MDIVKFKAIINHTMKYLFILLVLFSWEAYAVDIYKCNIDKRTEIAGCGFYTNCKDKKNGNKIIKPFVTSSKITASYTVLAFEDKLILKRDSDKHEYVFQRDKNDSLTFIINDNVISVHNRFNSFVLIKNNFYHGIGLFLGFKAFNSGICKRQ